MKTAHCGVLSTLVVRVRRLGGRLVGPAIKSGMETGNRSDKSLAPHK